MSVETPGWSPIFGEEARGRTRSDARLCNDLLFCIDEGGAISSEDALDCYLRRVCGETATLAGSDTLRQKIGDLTRFDAATPNSDHIVSRIGVYEELAIFSFTSPELRNEQREALLSGVLSWIDKFCTSYRDNYPEVFDSKATEAYGQTIVTVAECIKTGDDVEWARHVINKGSNMNMSSGSRTAIQRIFNAGRTAGPKDEGESVVLCNDGEYRPQTMGDTTVPIRRTGRSRY